MEKSLKLYLNVVCLLVVFSCKNTSNLTPTEKRELAEKRYKKAIQFRQGSIPFQNGIAEAVTIDSTFEAAVYELSVADLKRGLPNKWLPQYNKAVKLDPVTRIPWRGYLYLWFYRDYKKAIADFNASDSLTPDFIDAPQGHSVDYWRGIAYLGLNDYKNSNAYFEKHIAKEIKDFGEDYVDVTAFLYNGISYFEANNYEKALLNFDKQLKYSRNLSADAKYYKAQIFKAQGKNKQALETANEAIEDFNNGYNNKRAYVETLKQLYSQDLLKLKSEIESL